MKIMPPLRKAALKQKIAKYLLEDETVVNWSIVKKCMLMLILAAAVLLSRILWKAYVLLSPELWQWVNVPLMKSQLALNALSFLLLLALLLLCHAGQRRRWVQLALPFLSVGLFVISLCREGYLIGILSPAAMISYVSLAAVGLVLLDLDHFKQINDRHGHNKGDEALIKVSAILRQNLRSSDAAGRFGGEEFILILHESALDQALQAAERCRSAIQQMELLGDDGHPIQVTASFGIAASSPDMRPQQLLTQADKALYEAKACGRNSVRAYLAQAARPAAGI